MRLHENIEDFRTLIKITAEFFNTTEVYIEKDYWVTYILKNLFSSKYKDKVIFKGGTSLSKAYGLIERFSEDIDLQLINFSGNDNEKKRLLKHIEQVATKGLILQPNHPRESKRGNIRKTVYRYKKVYEGEFFQAGSDLIFEVNGMSIPEPWKTKQISSDIGKYLLAKKMKDIIKEFQLESFNVKVLNKERTFLEKIFAVLDYSFEENYLEELMKKIRHIYDISKLYRDEEVKEIFESDDFYKLADKVVIENDFFGKRKQRVYSESKFFKEDIISPLEKIYLTQFSKFVYKDLPDFKEVKQDLEIVLERVINWEKQRKK